MYMMLRVDDNVLVPINSDDLGIAVRIAAVVNESRKSTLYAQPRLRAGRLGCKLRTQRVG